MKTVKELLDLGYKLIGENSRGLKLYAMEMLVDKQCVSLVKVNTNGELLGFETFEKETVELLCNSGLIASKDLPTATLDASLTDNTESMEEDTSSKSPSLTTLEWWLKEMERRLMHAINREEAEQLVMGLSNDALVELSRYLKAYSVKTNKRSVVESILQCTYDAYHSHLTISGKSVISTNPL